MTEEEKSKFLEAVDIVCMECIGNAEDCEGCMLRKTCDCLSTP